MRASGFHFGTKRGVPRRFLKTVEVLEIVELQRYRKQECGSAWNGRLEGIVVRKFVPKMEKGAVFADALP